MVQEPEGNLQTQKQAGWDLNTQTRAVKSQSPNHVWKQVSEGLNSHLRQAFPSCGVTQVCTTSPHQGWWMSVATWQVFSQTHLHKHAKGQEGETKVRNLSHEGSRKEEIRAGERMAPTAWHLNRGFPLCTLSFLHSVFIRRAFFTRLLQMHVLSPFIVIPDISLHSKTVGKVKCLKSQKLSNDTSRWF